MNKNPYEHLRVSKENSIQEEILPVPENLEIKQELLSVSALNGNVMHNSSPRMCMMGSHWTQAAVPKYGDEDILQNGVSNIFARNTFGPLVKDNATIVGTVYRYNALSDRYCNQKIEQLIFYITDDGTFDYVEIPSYFKGGNSGYGFSYVIDQEKIKEDLERLRIDEGTRYAKSPTVRENDGYALGLNANMILCTHPDGTEDAVVVSESFAKRAMHERFEEKIIEFGSKLIPLNIYGDDNEYKPFPEIGDKIREDGLLAALRPIADIYPKKPDDHTYSPALLSPSGLRRYNKFFDYCTFCLDKGDEDVNHKNELYKTGEVVDIICYKNNKKISDNIEMMSKLAEKYAKSHTLFYKEILELYARVIKEYNDGYYFDGGIPLKKSHKLHRLIATAGVIEPGYMINRIKNEPKLKAMWKFNGIQRGKTGVNHLPDPTDIRLGNRNAPLDTYCIKFIIRYTSPIVTGSKISDKAGGKGIVSVVLPDNEMPIAPDGTRAEVIMTSSSLVGRSNYSRVYDHYLGAASRWVQSNLREMFNKSNIDIIENADDKTIEKMFTYLMGFIGKFDNQQFDIYGQATNEEKRIILKECLEKEVYIFNSCEKKKREYQTVMDIKNSEYDPPKYNLKIPYLDKRNVLKWHETKVPIYIAPLHVILLTMAPDAISTTSIPNVNAYGVFIRTNKETKTAYPYNNSPVRITGETEVRQYAYNGSRDLMPELMDRGASLSTHKHCVMGILKANKPTNIDNLVDREEIPFGDNEKIKLVKTFSSAIGYEPAYLDENQ